MASSINAKVIHRDGKANIKLGLDETNSKILKGDGDFLKIENSDGSSAKISAENIPFIPDDLSDENRLVSQKELREMMKNIKDIMDAASELAKIVGGISNE